MISKVGKRFLAGALAGVVSFTTLGMNTMSVLAEETSECLEASVNTMITTDGSKDVLYRFTPETAGNYQFYSVASGDTYGCIYDANKNVLYSDNDGGEELNFSITAELEANTDYYLAVNYFEIGAEGEISWKIEEVAEETVTESQEITEEVSEEETVTESEPSKAEDVKTEADTPKTQEVETKTSVTKGTYEYTEKDGVITITKYNGTDAVVTIPESIDGKTVGIIGEQAFEDNESVKEVTIPKTVTEIQYKAFKDCKNLVTLNFAPGSNLQKLGGKTFSNCSSLKAIHLPDSLTETDGWEFYECTSLEEVTLGSGLKTISSCMFLSTKSLKTITFPSNITTIEDYAFQSSGLVSLILPDTITEVGIHVFSYCDLLSDVKIGTGIKGISDYMFAQTRSLKEIIFPSNITYIGKAAFRGSGLESVIIPDTVKSVEAYAFDGCKNLKKAELGSGLTYVSEGVFSDSALEEVKIGENIKSLGLFSFSCNNFKEITIPNTVVELEYGAFVANSDLEKITVPTDLAKIGGHCFHYTKWFENQNNGDVYVGNVYYNYKGEMPANTTITIKDGTLGIAGFAFDGQENLTAVHIPYGVTDIGELAFFDCTSLKQIVIPSSVTKIWDYSIGYYKDWNSETRYLTSYGNLVWMEKVSDLVIVGDVDSAAEAYAQKFGFTFKKNEYTVNFYDGEKLISTQQVVSGESAKAPELTKEGYLLSWDINFSNVKKDLNVKAVWKNYAEIKLDENTVITNEKFDEILTLNEKFDVVIESNNDVTFTFGKGTMNPIAGKENYDFTTAIEKQYSKELPSYITESNFVLKIDYTYSGKLPAEASIRLLVGTDYNGKTLYYSWMKDDGTFAEVQNAAVEDGYMTVKQDHCSSYVVTTEEPKVSTDNGNQDNGNQDNGNQDNGNQDNGNQDNGNQDNGNQDNGNQNNGNQNNGNQSNGNQNNGNQNNGNQNNGTGTSPNTSTASMMGIYFVVALAGLVMVFSRKKVK